jgi:hypothetical protein
VKGARIKQFQEGDFMFRVYGKNSFQNDNITLDGSEMYHADIVLDLLQEKMKKYPEIDFRRPVDGADFSWIQEDVRNFNPDIMFDTHTNAFNGQAQGTVIFVNSEGYEFGVIAYENLAPLSPGNDRGIHTTKE